LGRGAHRSRHRLDRGDRLGDGRREVGARLRAVGRVLRRSHGRCDRRHGVDRHPRIAERPPHHHDRDVAAGLASSAIVPGLAMGAISFRATSKTFAGSTPVRALEEVSLDIRDGEFVALLGPSGCGKSTLLNLIAGFDVPTSGQVLFDGNAVERPGPDRGVVFQEASLFPWLTVWDNITFGPRVQYLPRDAYEAKAREMTKLVGLEAFTGALPTQLSGGMRQRVG